MGHKSKKTISIIVGFSGLLGLGLIVLAWLLSSSVMYPSYSCSEEHFIYCDDPRSYQCYSKIFPFNPLMANV